MCVDGKEKSNLCMLQLESGSPGLLQHPFGIENGHFWPPQYNTSKMRNVSGQKKREDLIASKFEEI